MMAVWKPRPPRARLPRAARATRAPPSATRVAPSPLEPVLANPVFPPNCAASPVGDEGSDWRRNASPASDPHDGCAPALSYRPALPYRGALSYRGAPSYRGRG